MSAWWIQDGTNVKYFGPVAPFAGWKPLSGVPAPVVVVETAADVTPKDSGGAALEAPTVVAPDTPSKPPARANVNVWQEYAEAVGVKVPEGATKAEIRALVDAHDQ